MTAVKNIVFVCVENSSRSQVAEAYARIYQPDGYAVYSAGSRPSGVVNSRALEAMAEVHYDLSRHQSRSLEQIPDIDFDAVITKGCGDSCPDLRAKLKEDWGFPDLGYLPIKEFRKLRCRIEQQVLDLYHRLANN